jgi:adenosylcobyric acid synthase
MLGRELVDEADVEGGRCVRGMELLPIRTIFGKEKHRTRVSGTFQKVSGVLEALTGLPLNGYEIHHGNTVYDENALPLTELAYANENAVKDGAMSGNIYGTYVHGIFDEETVAETILRTILTRKGYQPDEVQVKDRKAYKVEQYDLLADMIRANMDIEALYRILEVG